MMQGVVPVDPSEFHLSKPMEGNKKQGKDHIFHAQHITYPHFIWDSTGSCGGKLFKGHVKAENQEPWCCTATQGSTQAPHVHAGKLFVLRNQVTPESRQCFFFFFSFASCRGCLILNRVCTKGDMHSEAEIHHHRV